MQKGSFILIINGSPQGPKGNSGLLIKKMIRTYKKQSFKVLHLSQQSKTTTQIYQLVSQAKAVIFTTGTYWDSWGSPLQSFLEDFTRYEGNKKIVGKPAGVITLMHSVGGKEVLSRLQGVLSTFGFLIPPMSGMTYSLVSDIALKSKSSFNEDFWSLDDIQMILNNLELASTQQINWQTWPVDRKNPKRSWIKTR